MKTIIISVLGLFVCCAAGAQTAKNQHLYFSENPNAVAYSLPRTAITVGLVVEKETIRKGPYARFAQRLLGVVAPLADKELYQIKGASMSYSEESDPSKVYAIDANDKTLAALALTKNNIAEPNNSASLDNSFASSATDRFTFNDLGIAPIVTTRTIVSHIQNDSSFVKVAPDRTQIEEKSLEQMANDAADAIFTLRKRRFDLVTGEAGENVFGAGLEAAIKEIARIEQEYLSLFLGKQSVQQIVKEYVIVPDSGKLNYIVARFSDTEGVMSDSDLSGKPIVLELRPENRAAHYALPRKAGRDSRPLLYYRVADVAQCRLLDGKREICKERIPIYQLGATVDIPIGAVK